MIGITTAMVSRKAVVSHCAAFAVICRSTISRGSATLMIVSFRIIVKVEISSSMITTRSRAEICGGVNSPDMSGDTGSECITELGWIEERDRRKTAPRPGVARLRPRVKAPVGAGYPQADT
ncbi:hypothetical protein STA1M1_10880 [Sinisalibacter aestuarii]|uniref:Uncharacterized protein n=1 Tax=Sinisalibacter aestuarii TaxID=2949426 RepID=A0ABQ5LQL9_9RHOB|nr:hypothetical protein STA1M1_10880 [Sinisalibacter aestuarii]